MTVEFLTNEMKTIEQQIITFYKEIGEKSRLNPRATMVFAYLQLYKSLTQEQLKNLTKFSSSTISTTLKSFIHTGIIVKEIPPQTRTGVYKINDEKAVFEYITYPKIMDDLELLDLTLVEIASRLSEIKEVDSQLRDFFGLRINSVRNYIEVQRRVIKGEKKYSFFPENSSKLITLNTKVIYPLAIYELEKKLRIEFLSRNNPIRTEIISYFITRQNLDQETLMMLTKFSRSTVSRYIQRVVDDGFIKQSDKDYQHSIMYVLEHPSLAMIQKVLQIDECIISWEVKLQELLSNLKVNPKLSVNKKMNELVQLKIKDILLHIERLKLNSDKLKAVRNELFSYLY